MTFRLVLPISTLPSLHFSKLLNFFNLLLTMFVLEEGFRGHMRHSPQVASVMCVTLTDRKGCGELS